MRAVWLEDRRIRVRDDVPAPPAPRGEARIRVLLAGICGTDLELVKGYYPYTGVPGHEFVGRVEEAPGAPEWVGRRVVGEINAVCGDCPTCRANRPSHCERRSVLGIVDRPGVFAETFLLPVANLHAVPEELPDELAVFTEPAGAALRVLQQVQVAPGQRVAVIGPGRLGTLVAQALAGTGCDLVVVARRPASLARLGALGLRAITSAALPAGRLDLVVECTGNVEGLALARRAVRPQGTIVLKSTYHGEVALDLSAVVVDEVTLVGSRCGPFAPALEALRAGRLDPRGLVEATCPLAEAPAAFERAGRPGALKVLLRP